MMRGAKHRMCGLSMNRGEVSSFLWVCSVLNWYRRTQGPMFIQNLGGIMLGLALQ